MSYFTRWVLCNTEYAYSQCERTVRNRPLTYKFTIVKSNLIPVHWCCLFKIMSRSVCNIYIAQLSAPCATKDRHVQMIVHLHETCKRKKVKSKFDIFIDTYIYGKESFEFIKLRMLHLAKFQNDFVSVILFSI